MAFVDNTIEVEADIRKVYDVWTAFEDFPEFMEVVERIDLVADDSLHWVAVVEDDVIEWDADIIEHVPDQSVSWQALDGRETGKVTFEKIGEIHKMGTAILLVEQNVSRALSLVQRAYVLESGNVIMHGSSAELADNKQVQAAYLGI